MVSLHVMAELSTADIIALVDGGHRAIKYTRYFGMLYFWHTY
jgi:hypothetical protein